MSAQQAEELLLETVRYTRELAQQGVKLFGVGELGMANTTPAAAIVSVLTGEAPEAVVGIGANLPESQLGHKAAVVRKAIAVNQPDPADGLAVLAKVGGYDLLGMSGVILGARHPAGCRWCWTVFSPMLRRWQPAALRRRSSLILSRRIFLLRKGRALRLST